MRCFALFLLMPSVAFGFDSSTENLVFEANQELFRGEDVAAYFPSADSTIAIKFRADTSTALNLQMAASSKLSWPQAMGHTLNTVSAGGLAQYIARTTIGADVRVNALGQTVEAPVWEQSFEWAADKYFDSLLLPGGSGSSVLGLTLPGAHYFQEDIELVIAEGVVLTFGIEGNPVINAVISGESISLNGVTVTETGTTTLPMPAVNRGTYNLAATWNGHVDADWGVELIQWVKVDWDSFTFRLPLYTFDWALGTDSRSITSKVTNVEHSIPAIDTYTVLDLGNVEVGSVVEREFAIDNIGLMTLTGNAIVQGDAVFDVLDRNFSAIANNHTSVTVEFAPTQQGDFEGVLVLRSNDPLDPEIEVPIIGRATPLPIIDGDPSDDGSGDAYGSIRGCGCSSTSTMTSAPYAVFALGLVGLLGLRRRD